MLQELDQSRRGMLEKACFLLIFALSVIELDVHFLLLCVLFLLCVSCLLFIVAVFPYNELNYLTDADQHITSANGTRA